MIQGMKRIKRRFKRSTPEEFLNYIIDQIDKRDNLIIGMINEEFLNIDKRYLKIAKEKINKHIKAEN